MKLLLFIPALAMYLSSNAQIHERWDVKTLTDGFAPNLSSVKKVTVAQIELIKKVNIKNTQPRMNFEKRVIKISGTITKIKLENGPDGDNDYHIEISDGSMGDSAMVCEAVDPVNAVTAASPYVGKFKIVRSLAQSLKLGDKVTFTGMMFQDRKHSPSPNRTRNFIEMHPILIASKN